MDSLKLNLNFLFRNVHRINTFNCFRNDFSPNRIADKIYEMEKRNQILLLLFWDVADITNKHTPRVLTITHRLCQTINPHNPILRKLNLDASKKIR